MSISDAERVRLFGRPGAISKVAYKTPWGDYAICHTAIVQRFRRACEDAARESQWIPRRIDSYNPRNIRGSSQPSLHGWALAWDFFATPEQVVPPGGVWKPQNTVPEDFARCFMRQGFKWGRYFSRQDWPHIEWSEGLPDTLLPRTPQEARAMGYLVAVPRNAVGMPFLPRNPKMPADRVPFYAVNEKGEVKNYVADGWGVRGLPERGVRLNHPIDGIEAGYGFVDGSPEQYAVVLFSSGDGGTFVLKPGD